MNRSGQQILDSIILDLEKLKKEFKGSVNQVDGLLKKLRNEAYSPDKNITDDWLTRIKVYYQCKCKLIIEHILINYLVPEFYRGQKSIVIPKSWRIPSHSAKYMLFSSNFQLQCLMNYATFKSAPPHFKQILHNISIDTRTNLAVLVSICFMQSKDSGMYQ